jgi:hypothetical protein
VKKGVAEGLEDWAVQKLLLGKVKPRLWRGFSLDEVVHWFGLAAISHSKLKKTVASWHNSFV